MSENTKPTNQTPEASQPGAEGRPKKTLGQLDGPGRLRVSRDGGEYEMPHLVTVPGERAKPGQEAVPASAGDLLLNPEPDAQPEPEQSEPKKKPGKAKKKKPAKARKVKRTGSRAGAHRGKKKKGSKAPLVVFLLLAFVALGAGAAWVVSGSLNSAEDLIERAETLTGQGKYEQAMELYGRVADEGEELVAEAYLGMADILVEADDAESALPRLEIGYNETGDDRLLERYESIAGESMPDVGGEDGAEVGDGNGESAPANRPIQWQDPAFERMVRMALELDSGVDIYPSDLSGITCLRILGSSHAVVSRGGESSGLANLNSVDSYSVDGVVYDQRGEITSLADVANFPNLTRLTVAYNRVESIDGVQKLPRLRMLALYANEIDDLSPLEGMDSLRWLYLFNNNITDLGPLSSLPELEGLSIQHNGITDLSPLSSLDNLEELFLSNNRISDISPLTSLNRLKILYAQQNQVGSLSALSGLSRLTDINFTDNPVSDYGPVSHVANINRTASYSN